MKRGTTIRWDYNQYGRSGARITKARGRLTLDEIEEALQYGGGGNFNGHYALLINAGEQTCGGNGLWLDEDARTGDDVFLVALEDSGDCPVCGSMLPPFEYCPECGEPWKKSKSSP